MIIDGEHRCDKCGSDFQLQPVTDSNGALLWEYCHDCKATWEREPDRTIEQAMSAAYGLGYRLRRGRDESPMCRVSLAAGIWEARCLVDNLELVWGLLTGEPADVDSRELHQRAMFMRDAECEIERLTGGES